LYTGLRLGEKAPGDRPYVVCNFVSSADGKATASGKTAKLGGEGDRAAFHLLRTQVDAILAGTGTLRVERYGALARRDPLKQVRLDEGRAAQPLGVVISRSGDIPFDIPLFADPDSTVAIYTHRDAVMPATAARLIVHELPGGESELRAVLTSLRHDHGVDAVLCEGGPALFNALLAEDLVDELFLTLAPALVGGGELGLTSGQALDSLLPLKLVWALEQDGHLFLRYARRRAKS
ncbi:MAG: dihydrofolate reductase family protein, partial [Solirubrobacteraceae bacterium]